MANEDHPDLKLLETHVAQLSEHFENVQIFANRYSGDESDPDNGTVSATFGTGNWHARRGQISQWLLRSDERERVDVRKEESED